GYEGSGRTFTRMVVDWMPEPKQVVMMRYPVRYAPGDPLEEWLYKTLVLKPHLPDIEKVGKEPEYTWFKPEDLAVDKPLLRQLYSILVEAHYRNEPNDLAMMIDAPHYEVHALLVDGKPLAVAETAYDSCAMPYESRMLVDLLSQYVGRLACIEPGARIVRIAVHPQFKRRGYGSKLLAAALLIQRKMVGFLPVTAPTPHNIQSFFTVLAKALEELDVEHHVIEKYGLVIGVSGRWFHVRYHTPDQTSSGSFTIVDEAAAIGPARLRRIIRYSRRLLVATTVHGYEGSGRTFTRMVVDLPS
ncbi:MAG TPA: GNAT family N-acetyltransferase, partial [Aquificae bacterium]|nr:GNAT family N-acetyltransferase [Aquificota bacterium]